jgi:rhomboid protease GluP
LTIDPPATWIEVFRSDTRKAVEDHALVLEATGIASGMAEAFGRHILLVRAEDVVRAHAELDKYVRENREPAPPDDVRRPLAFSVAAALVYAGVLLALDVAQKRELGGFDWWTAGLADATSIRHGAWWRSVTALLLHADALHLASNLAFGAMFGVMLAQSIGIGFAWFSFLVAGGIGNWLNAWVQFPSHASIGASTAIFGMLGVQVAHDWVRRRQLHHNLFRRYAPLAVGAALLAWLGGDGRPVEPSTLPRTLGDLDVALPRIDVTAHVLGFSTGLALGALFGWSRSRFQASAGAQAALAGTVVGLFGLAWFLALR